MSADSDFKKSKILNIIRHVSGIFFSSAFSFLTIGLLIYLIDKSSLYYSYFSIFLIFFGIFISSIYASVIGEMQIKKKTIIAGIVAGFLVTLFISPFVALPVISYKYIYIFLSSALASSVAAYIFRAEDYGYVFNNAKFSVGMHIFEALVIIPAIFISIFTLWPRPFLIIIALTGFSFWNFNKGCPLAFLEQKQRGVVWEEGDGFMTHYLKKLTGLNFSDKGLNSFFYSLTGFFVLYYIFDLVRMGH